jgi:hypothetical protein
MIKTRNMGMKEARSDHQTERCLRGDHDAAREESTREISYTGSTWRRSGCSMWLGRITRSSSADHQTSRLSDPERVQTHWPNLPRTGNRASLRYSKHVHTHASGGRGPGASAKSWSSKMIISKQVFRVFPSWTAAN